MGKSESFLRKKAVGTVQALCFFLFGASLLLFPQAVKANVSSSLFTCLGVLVPSLFPFMVLASFGADSQAGDLLGPALGWLPRFLFRLPHVCALPVLMGFFGGYPAGARGASLLLARGEITEKEAGRMMLFCVNPGVAFVVTYLGGSVLHNTHTGWLLFWSVTLSGIVLGILSGLFCPLPPTGHGEKTGGGKNPLISSIAHASSGMLSMCACIVVFSVLTAILHASGLYQRMASLLARSGLLSPTESVAALSFFIEVTGGVGDAAKFQVSPVLYAFGLAFGGLCVHLQVFSLFPAFPVKKWKFFLFRFLHGLLSAGCYLVLTRLFPNAPQEALAPVWGYPAQFLSGTWAGGLSLLLMCGAFLLFLGKDWEGIAQGPEK